MSTELVLFLIVLIALMIARSNGIWVIVKGAASKWIHSDRAGLCPQCQTIAFNREEDWNTYPVRVGNMIVPLRNCGCLKKMSEGQRQELAKRELEFISQRAEFKARVADD